jgi:hypothetical protein
MIPHFLREQSGHVTGASHFLCSYKIGVRNLSPMSDLSIHLVFPVLRLHVDNVILVYSSANRGVRTRSSQ